MKKFALGVLLFVVFAISSAGLVKAEENPVIYFFYGQGCPHCAIVENYFSESSIYSRYPIERKEIYFNRENIILYSDLLDNLGIPQEFRGVPTVVIGQKVLVGDAQIIENFETEADKFLERRPVENNLTIETQNSEQLEQAEPATATASDNDSLQNKPDLTILAVITASLVDAINPCAFAVLIILMTAILASGDNKRALKAGLAFSLSIFISYFLMGIGFYTALSIGSLSAVFYKIVGWLAIAVGLFNLKDFFWYGKGFLMEVPMSWRPKLKSLINGVTNPFGAFVIGFLVSLFLLPCTSGPYIVILGMLAKKIFLAKAIVYLILYNLVFVLPMILITLAVYKGFDPVKAESARQKHLKTLHLIAGVIMLAMGIAVLSGII